MGFRQNCSHAQKKTEEAVFTLCKTSATFSSVKRVQKRKRRINKSASDVLMKSPPMKQCSNRRLPAFSRSSSGLKSGDGAWRFYAFILNSTLPLLLHTSVCCSLFCSFTEEHKFCCRVHPKLRRQIYGLILACYRDKQSQISSFLKAAKRNFLEKDSWSSSLLLRLIQNRNG